MKLIELKKELPYLYEAIAHMFKIIKIPEEEYDNIDIKENNWFLNYEWTNEQQEEYKDWLYRKLWGNKEWRKQIMSFPIRKKDLIDKTINAFVFGYGLKVKQE